MPVVRRGCADDGASEFSGKTRIAAFPYRGGACATRRSRERRDSARGTNRPSTTGFVLRRPSRLARRMAALTACAVYECDQNLSLCPRLRGIPSAVQLHHETSHRH